MHVQLSSGTRPRGYKTYFSCSTQLSTKFQLLITTKIPTNKEVSCFKSLRCCIYHANKCKNATNCWHFNIHEQDKFHTQLSLVWKKFYNLRARCLNFGLSLHQWPHFVFTSEGSGGSRETLLLAYAVSTKISWAGSNDNLDMVCWTMVVKRISCLVPVSSLTLFAVRLAIAAGNHPVCMSCY